MSNIETVYQAIQFINQLDEGKITKASVHNITNKTGLSDEEFLTALKVLYANHRITADLITSTGRDDYGEVISIKNIVAND